MHIFNGYFGSHFFLRTFDYKAIKICVGTPFQNHMLKFEVETIRPDI